MPQTKEIDPYRNPTKEISLGEILKMHGVPSAEQESLQEPSIANELVQKYVDDQLTKRGYSPAFVKAADAGVKAMIIAAPVAGLVNRMAMPEAFSSAGTAASAPSQTPRLTELLQGGGQTTGLEPRSPVPYDADYMGSTRQLRWNELPNRLGYEPSNPAPREPWAPGEWEDYTGGGSNPPPQPRNSSVLRFNTPDDVYAHLDAGDGPRHPFTLPEDYGDPGVGIYNRMDRGASVAERAEADRVAQAQRQRYLSGGRPPMRQPYEYPREDYNWRVRGNVRHQAPAPVRSLPPYDQPSNRFYGNRPTKHIGNYGHTRTGELKGSGSQTGHPTGMFQNPSNIEFSNQRLGQEYTSRAAESIPRNMRRPGLVVYEVPGGGGRVSYAYFDKDNKVLAGATAHRYNDGSLHVASFGGDMTKGIAGKKAAVEVGMALLRSGKLSGGAMSQYSRGLFARLAEAAANPKMRDIYRKTRLFHPLDKVDFEK